MTYAFFPGCTVQTEQYGYELSIREVLPKLGVELKDLEGSGCCGFQTFSASSPIGYKYLAARNLALAENLGLDILTPCNSCYFAFNEVIRDLKKDAKIMKTVNEALSNEGLVYLGEAKAHHILEVLHNNIGVNNIAEKVTRPFKNLKLVSHLGCFGFRINNLQRPNEKDSAKLDELIKALGAETVDYDEKLDCCGYFTSLADKEASLKITGNKLRAIYDYEVDGLVVVCPLCFKMFDTGQVFIKDLSSDDKVDVPVIYYTQLLGLAMNISPKKLGLLLNQSPVDILLSQVGDH